MKICQETPNWLKLGKNIWHFTWRPKYILFLLATLYPLKSYCL